MGSLETQLLEEPLVLALLVDVLELDAGLEAVRLALYGILQVLGRQLLKADVVRRVAGLFFLLPLKIQKRFTAPQATWKLF